MGSSRFPPLLDFAFQDDAAQLIPADLCRALDPEGNVVIEVTFDTGNARRTQFSYVDIVNAAGDRLAHLSLRPSDGFIVLNTTQANVWGEASAARVPFDRMRRWRLYLVVGRDRFHVEIGGKVICRHEAARPIIGIEALVTNTTARPALRPVPDTKCAGLFDLDLDDGHIRGVARIDETGDPGALSATSADGRLKAVIAAEVLTLDGAAWLVFKAEGFADAETRAMIELTSRRATLGFANAVFAPAVEVSWCDVVLRGARATVEADIAWPGARPDMSVAPGPVITSPLRGSGSGLSRRAAAFADLMAMRGVAPDDTVTLGPFEGGGAAFRMRIGDGLGAVFPGMVQAVFARGDEPDRDWEMILISWWSALQTIPALRAAALGNPGFRAFLAARQLVPGVAEAGADAGAVGEIRTDDYVIWRTLRHCHDILEVCGGQAGAARDRITALLRKITQEPRQWILLMLGETLVENGLEDILESGISEAFISAVEDDDAPPALRANVPLLLAVHRRYDEMQSFVRQLAGDPLRPADCSAVGSIATLLVRRGCDTESLGGYLDALYMLVDCEHGAEFSGFRHASYQRAFIRLLEDCNRHPEAFQLRILGLVAKLYLTTPEFWDELGASWAAEDGSLLARRIAALGRQARAIEKGLSTGGRSGTDVPDGPDARMRMLGRFARFSHGNLATMRKLELRGGTDCLRLLAHPMAEEKFPSVKGLDAQLVRDEIAQRTPLKRHPHQGFLRSLGDGLAAGAKTLDPILARSGQITAEDVENTLTDVAAWRLAAGQTGGADSRDLMLHILSRAEGRAIAALHPGLVAAAWRLHQAGGLQGAGTIHAHLRATFDRFFTAMAPAGLSGGQAGGDKSAGFFSDTLVAILTCQPYLDTRARACRETWVRDLATLGIPHLFFCGSRPGEKQTRIDAENRIVHLPVGDAYEDLPEKSLAMFRWIDQHYPAMFTLKIDDDCYLDVENFFCGMAYRQSNYFGRLLQAYPAAFNRTWHQTKATHEKQRQRLDSSPSGTRYADGGGGYVLSRAAIAGLTKAAEGARGLRLRSAACYEDKLIGDLLAESGIEVSSAGYTSLQMRRTHSRATPVVIYDQTFLPAATSPIAMVHLDAAEPMRTTQAQRGARLLSPSRIWPMHEDVTLNYLSNQLQVFDFEKSRDRLAAAKHVCVGVMRNEITILPHFLAHYRKLGIEQFLLIDNLSDDGSREFMMAQDDVLLFSAAGQYRLSHYGVDWQRTVLDHFCAGKWVVLADADEFLLTQNSGNNALAEHCRAIEAEGANAATIFMVDMYPRGDMALADLATGTPQALITGYDAAPVIRWAGNRGPFGNAVSHVSSLRHRLMPDAPPYSFTAQKIALIRYNPLMSFSEGFHFGTGLRTATAPLAFLHYKFTANFAERVAREVERGQHFDNSTEYRAYANLLREGRKSLWSDAVSHTLDANAKGALNQVLSRIEPFGMGA